MSRKFTYVEPGEDGVTPVYITMTEEEILDDYYDYWKTRAQAVLEKERRDGGNPDPPDFSARRCIEDWKIIHWAWETTDHNSNNSKHLMKEVAILDESDGVRFVVTDTDCERVSFHIRIDQEDDFSDMKKLFDHLGIESTYEEDY